MTAFVDKRSIHLRIAPEVENVVRLFISRVQQRTRIVKAYIYGSHAHGNPGKWSDIDIAVVSPDFSDDLFGERIRLMHIAHEIDSRIEPNPYRPVDFVLDDPLVSEINQSGIEIVVQAR